MAASGVVPTHSKRVHKKNGKKKERGVASGPTRHCTTLTSLDAVSKGVEKKDAVELFEAWQQSSYRQPLSCYGSH